MSFYKKIRTIILSTVVFSALSATSAFAANTGIITGDNVNIRNTGAGTGEVIGKAHKGSTLDFIAKEGNFYKVSFNGTSNAYVAAEFFNVTKAEGTVKGTNINIRSGASTNSAVIKSVTNGDVLTVIGQNSTWYQLAFNNGGAYVSKEFLSGQNLQFLPQIAEQKAAVQNTYAIVTADTGLKLRTAPSTGEVIETLSNGTVVDVVEGGGQWIRIKTDGGKQGYVSAEFVSVRTGEKPSRSNAGSKGDEIITYAKQFLGTKYVYGGNDLRKGVDCSGFVYQVMKHFGINLQRSSAGMAKSNGYFINKSELAAGDLVFFDSSGANNGVVSHVGIYIGNGDYIHSSSGKAMSVIISNLNEPYSASTYVSAKRVIR